MRFDSLLLKFFHRDLPMLGLFFFFFDDYDLGLVRIVARVRDYSLFDALVIDISYLYIVTDSMSSLSILAIERPQLAANPI